MHRLAVSTVAMAAAVVCTMSSCSDNDTGPSAGEQSPSANAYADREALFTLYRGSSFRYGTVADAADLASTNASELALSGTVAGFEETQSNDGLPWAIMRVKPLDVFDGNLDQSGEARVKVLAPPTDSDVSLNEAIPPGTPTVLYLARSESDDDLYLPISPQGFILADSASAFFPYDQSLPQEESLEEQVPEGVDVP